MSLPKRAIGLLWAALRIVYAAWFVFFPVFMLVAFGGHVPGSGGPNADSFLQALRAIGFIEPLLIAVYLLGGITLLFARTAPLGIVVLAAPVVVIFLFHMFHTHLFLWGSIWPVGLAALAWRFRSRFSTLWRLREVAQRQG